MGGTARSLSPFILGLNIGDRVAPEKRKALPPAPMIKRKAITER